MWQNAFLTSMNEEELCHLLHTSAPVTSLDRHTSVEVTSQAWVMRNLTIINEEELCPRLHTNAPVTSLDRHTSMDSNLK